MILKILKQFFISWYIHNIYNINSNLNQFFLNINLNLITITKMGGLCSGKNSKK